MHWEKLIILWVLYLWTQLHLIWPKSSCVSSWWICELLIDASDCGVARFFSKLLWHNLTTWQTSTPVGAVQTIASPRTKVFPQKITIFIVACVLRNCFVDFCQISCKPISLEGTSVTFKISSSSNWRKPDQVLRNYATVQLHTWVPNSISAIV